MFVLFFLGVYVSNEEHFSSSMTLLTIKEHLFKLQSEFLSLRNSLNAMELNHEKTKKYFQELNSHIDLFSKIEQTERYIADWEYSSILKNSLTEEAHTEVQIVDSGNDMKSSTGNGGDSFFQKNILDSSANQETFKASYNLFFLLSFTSFFVFCFLSLVLLFCSSLVINQVYLQPKIVEKLNFQ
jgi:hypothetical protein